MSCLLALSLLRGPALIEVILVLEVERWDNLRCIRCSRWLRLEARWILEADHRVDLVRHYHLQVVGWLLLVRYIALLLLLIRYGLSCTVYFPLLNFLIYFLAVFLNWI